MKISRKKAIAAVKLAESALNGIAHTALGGSTLHIGTSSHDIDIFVYPRKGDPEIQRYIDHLRGAGFIITNDLTQYGVHEQYAVDRCMIITKWKGVQVDFFFLQDANKVTL